MTNEAMSTANQDNQQFSPGIVSGLLKGLKNEKESSEFSDVQIKVDNYEFRCHRVVLAACSGFFKAVFTSGMKEDLERKVILQEISRETFADVLECMYAGWNVINDTNMFEIWHAANQLQILFLLHECEVFLKQKINPENCLAIYQHGKLLDSKEMVQFSWSYIVDNFESIRRSEELMMLTKEEMEALIASPDLKTISEDHVLETVLSWVDYKPAELFDETNELVYKCDTPGQTQNDGSQSENISYAGHNQDISAVKDRQNNDSDHSQSEGTLSGNSKAVSQDYDLPLKENLINNHHQPQSEGTLSENCDEVNKQQDMLLEDDKGSAHEQLTKSRAEYLIDLLKLTRVCLLSGKCLMKTMNKANVRTSKAAQAILQNALEYILRKDSLHVFCPASAIHRRISHLENVIVAVTTDNSTNVLVCRRQNGRWYGLGIPFREWIYCPLITCFNNDVYLGARNKSIHVYETSRNTWRAILDSPDQENTCLLTIGHFLYAVRPTSECYSLEIINILDPRQWVKVSSLPSDLGSIDCSAVIGDNILFFGSIAGKSEAQVFVFDTTTFRCVPLNGTRPLSSSKVFFSNGRDSFVLQQSGTLYRIQTCLDEPFMQIVYETMLWDFDRDIKGALLVNDELWLFGPSFSTNDTDARWELSIPGVFKCVKNIICSHGYSNFMHTVIPTKYLSEKSITF